MVKTTESKIALLETKIALLQKDMEYVKQQMAENHQDLKDDISELRRLLKGNGNPGLVAEVEQAKGGIKMLQIVVSIGLTLIGLIIAWLSLNK